MLLSYPKKTLFALVCLLFVAAPSLAAIPVPKPPNLQVESYVLQDFASGQIIAAQEPDKRIEPASLTKLMTIYIAFAELKRGKISDSDEVTISTKAWKTGGSRMFIEPNTKVTVDALLHGVATQSGNDASVALAEYIAGTESTFAAYMNQVAAKLGLTHTHFVNATGLPDPNHYTTAHDLAKLTHALIRDFPKRYELFAEKSYTYNSITQRNRNGLLWRDQSVDGLKTGHTKSAGYCLVASAKREGRRLITVVTGASSENARLSASESLLNYGFRFFETDKLYAADQTIQAVPLWKGAENSVPVGVQKTLYVTVPRGRQKDLKREAVVQSQLMAPVEQGQQIGTLRISLDDEVVREVPLYALKTVPLGGWWTRLVDEARLYIKNW